MFFGYGSSNSISSPFELSIFSITSISSPFESDERELELDELEDELELETELELELDESDCYWPDLPERVILFSILKAFDAQKQITETLFCLNKKQALRR